ncbi:MAG: nitroreductase family protein [Desulfobacterales bacterium]
MFIDLVRNRRSVRSFEQRPVEPEKVKILVEAALRAPSSRRLNPWEFVVVTDREKLKELSRAKPHGAGFMAEAALGIVVLVDPERCDVWIEDASIAMIFIQMAAESLELGSCWIQIRKRQHESGSPASDPVKKLLDVPDRFEVEAMVAIGYPVKKPSPHGVESLQHEKVHADSYGKPFPVS